MPRTEDFLCDFSLFSKPPELVLSWGVTSFRTRIDSWLASFFQEVSWKVWVSALCPTRAPVLSLSLISSCSPLRGSLVPGFWGPRVLFPVGWSRGGKSEEYLRSPALSTSLVGEPPTCLARCSPLHTWKPHMSREDLAAETGCPPRGGRRAQLPPATSAGSLGREERTDGSLLHRRPGMVLTHMDEPRLPEGSDSEAGPERGPGTGALGPASTAG